MSNEEHAEIPEDELQGRLETVMQLKTSGVQFCLSFVGTVIVETSIASLADNLQNNVAQSCMQLVANAAAHTMSSSDSELTNATEHIRSNSSTIFGSQIDLNISSKAILLLSSEGNMKAFNRFNIRDVSVVSPGRNELSNLFCFIASAKVAEQSAGKAPEVVRKCYVFDAGDEMKEVLDSIAFAFEIAFSEIDHSTNITSTPAILVIKPIRSAPSLPSSEPPELPPRSTGRSFSQAGTSKDTLSPLSPNGTTEKSIGDDPIRTRSRSSSSRGEMSVEVSEARYQEITENLWQAHWFHGLLHREESERRLRADGQFLVRQSPSIARQFVLSGMHNGEVRHMCLIGRGPSGRISSKQGDFRSIVELINFHLSGQPLTSNLASDQSQVALQLKYPVNRKA